MVAVEVTPEILSALESAGAEKSIDKSSVTCTVPHKALCAALRACPNSPSLQSLLSTAEVHLTHADAVAKHTPTTRNPVLEKRIARLKARVDDAEYAAIVRDVSRASASNAEVEAQRMGKFAPQLSLGANVVVTMATCFVAGYFVFKNTSGSETVGLIGGVAGLIVALGVEATLLLTKMYTIDNAVQRTVQRRQRLADRAQGTR